MLRTSLVLLSLTLSSLIRHHLSLSLFVSLFLILDVDLDRDDKDDAGSDFVKVERKLF